MVGANLYGQRDLYSRDLARLVVCPDGRQFLQNAPSTYRRTWVPAVMPPEDRSSKLGNIARRNATEGTMRNTLAQAQMDQGAVSYTELARFPSPDGKMMILEMTAPGGKLFTISRLRSWKEGNGF